MSELFIYGLVAHLVADWFFQNDWMARNKADLRHSAAWVHGVVHLAATALVFPFSVALVLALSHVLIDTRRPLTWWRKTFRQTTEGPAALHVAIWQDQVMHIVMLLIAASRAGGSI